MKRFCCAIILLVSIFIIPPSLPAAMLGADMSTFHGTLKKITEISENYKIRIGEKDFTIPRSNRNLIKNARLMVGKKVTVIYQAQDYRIQSLKYFKATTHK